MKIRQSRQRLHIFQWLMLAGLLVMAAPAAWGSDVFVGARVEHAINFIGRLEQAAVFVDLPVNFKWQPFTSRQSDYYLQVAAGAFINGSPDARPFIEVGPLISIHSREERGGFLRFGIAATLIGGTEFRNRRELGGSFFFTTHLSLGWRFDKWIMAFRIQHTSNAHLNNKNPGVNMIGLELGHTF